MTNFREKDFLTVLEVAEILRMGKSKAYDFVNSAGCPFNVVKFDHLIRIPTNNFIKWYDSLEEKQEQDRKRGRK